MKVRVTQKVVWTFETDQYTIAQLRQDAEDGGCLAMDLARDADMYDSTETISRVKEQKV
jgi:hypothetical protein